jgi:N-acetylglucosaminyl-diphospho-decaprenol L-rhamnosyltransferase
VASGGRAPLIMKPSVLVVIVHYRTPALTIECLRSLDAEVRSYGNASVVVIDNQSQDGSVPLIAEAIRSEGWGDWARLVEAPVNGGFAYGNNQVIAPALAGPNPPDYFWLLNPDTTAYPGAMAALVDFMAARPHAGLAGSAIEEQRGVIWPYAFRFPSLLSELDDGLKFGVVTKLLSRWAILRPVDGRDACVDWVPGASLMVKREVFEAIGLMDENYFLYYEETDFCLQAQRAGWQCWYVPASRVFHIAGASTGMVDRPPEPRRLPRYWFESRRRYFIKNHSRLYAIATDCVWIVSHALWRVRRVLQRKPGFEPPHLLGDFVRNSSLVTSRIAVNPAVVKHQA